MEDADIYNQNEEAALMELLELSQDLEIGVLTPADFASHLARNESIRKRLITYLPLLLEANSFALSPALGQALAKLGDASVLHNVSFRNPSLATSSLLLVVPDSFVQSEPLKRIRHNALAAAATCDWPHVTTASVAHSAMQQLASIAENGADLGAKTPKLPETDCNQFNAWYKKLRDCPTDQVDRFVTEVNDLQDASSIAFLSFAYDDSGVNATAFAKTILQISACALDRTDIGADKARLHTYLLQLTNHICEEETEDDSFSWKTIAIAFAVLYRSSNLTGSNSAWWSSLLLAIRHHQASDNRNGSSHMLLVPFLAVECPPTEVVTELFFLISGNSDMSSMYSVLRFTRAMDKRFLRRREFFSFMGSCLPLPELIFNQTLNIANNIT